MSIQLMLYQRSRPTKIDDYVFVDDNLKAIVKKWEERQFFDHCILYGPPGTGKTTLGLLLCNICGVDESDIMIINASTDTGVDIIRDMVMPFTEAISSSSAFRVVILEESDALSKRAQESLKILMEDTMGSARFIFTTNNFHKVDEALKSRCKKYNIQKLSKDDYTYRVANVLVENGIKFEIEDLMFYVDKNYPDMRGIYNDIEDFTFDGTLNVVKTSFQEDRPDWMEDAIKLFIDGKLREGRDVVCKNIAYDEYEQFYRLMYENLEWWCGNDVDKKDQALIAIKDALVADHHVGDREIVLSACLTQLSLI